MSAVWLEILDPKKLSGEVLRIRRRANANIIATDEIRCFILVSNIYLQKFFFKKFFLPPES